MNLKLMASLMRLLVVKLVYDDSNIIFQRGIVCDACVCVCVCMYIYN